MKPKTRWMLTFAGTSVLILLLATGITVFLKMRLGMDQVFADETDAVQPEISLVQQEQVPTDFETVLENLPTNTEIDVENPIVPETTIQDLTSTIENAYSKADGGNIEDDLPMARENMLGYAAFFHVFAEHVWIKSHMNGNMAVNVLSGKQGFGTNIKESELLPLDLFYIQSLNDIANSAFVDATNRARENKVIFGEDVAIGLKDGYRPTVNCLDIEKILHLDHLYQEEVFQDKKGMRYLDITKYFDNNLAPLSTKLANLTPAITLQAKDFTDQNKRIVQITDYTKNKNNEIVINLDADVLTVSTVFEIHELSSEPVGTTVIVNVDTKGNDPYVVDSEIKIRYIDGNYRTNHETEYFGDNHLLWNFYNSQAPDKQYTGTVITQKAFQGSVLVPNGKVEATTNLDGNMIAREVVVNGETHRWDFQGPNGNGEEEIGGEEEGEDPDPKPTPDPEPTPGPDPDPEPTPEPTPDPEPIPDPDPTPEPTPDPDPDQSTNEDTFESEEGVLVPETEAVEQAPTLLLNPTQDKATPQTAPELETTIAKVAPRNLTEAVAMPKTGNRILPTTGEYRYALYGLAGGLLIGIVLGGLIRRRPKA